jgi:hypothetical protein|tara:strand:- start:770 stop:973 length:204 start_codon:yes stop_codon:yes gene_type:complete
MKAIKNLSDRQMPYEVVKMGDKFAVKTTSGPSKGKLHGITTKAKAEAQKRLLDMIMMRSMAKNSKMK